ncbi:MAG: helicase [Gammaproteobacteria bacterium SG8_11]|nr:MAG: helicase [Gammaproteobacteria bacterium SG8_11]
MPSIYELLGQQGPFAKHIPDFVPRVQQQEMAQVVADALQDYSSLVAEAGTGTGKTFAYLVPALISGKKVIISTGTKNLQDQIFNRDLPKVLEVLGLRVPVSILKGRNNYFCHYRFEQKQLDGRMTPQQQHDMLHIKQWLNVTKTGDVSEIKEIPEGAAVWPLVTSTADNCLGSDCPFLSDCFVNQARRQAQQSDLVVVNHHLFFADMALKDDGFGEVLPQANAFIFDEAHQMFDVATRFFGETLSSRQIVDLARDSKLEVLQDAPDLGAALSLSGALEQAAKEFRLALGISEHRSPWHIAASSANVQTALQTLANVVTDFATVLKSAAERGAGIEKCFQRMLLLKERLAHFLQQNNQMDEQLASDSHILWYETHQKGFVLHKTPTDVAPQFESYMAKQRAAWVFTSATLTVGNSFKHFTNALGITEASTYTWDSPFDFKHQALLYVPTNMPDPNAPQYTQAVVDVIKPVINVTRGRTFILVTSYKAMNFIAKALRRRMPYPLLVQGEMPRTEILERFRSLGNAVLVGTSSFWEGVDVKGEALSCVIIDKLPFSAPDEPVLQARIEQTQQRGGNPFMEIQLPRAVITLKQGIGRLIRDVNDQGVLVICDPRLYSKSYGRVFLQSLPDLDITREFTHVNEFFNTVDENISA